MEKSYPSYKFGYGLFLRSLLEDLMKKIRRARRHFTPREVINLVTPHYIKTSKRQSSPNGFQYMTPACGTGGMLTESQNFIKDKKGEIRANCHVLLYGKEINDETYAICKSDMMIKGDDPEFIKNGSTLATDEFSNLKFDFMA